MKKKKKVNRRARENSPSLLAYFEQQAVRQDGGEGEWVYGGELPECDAVRTAVSGAGGSSRGGGDGVCGGRGDAGMGAELYYILKFPTL